MVIHLGLNRSPPRYLIGSPGSVRLAPSCLNCRCGGTFSRPAPLAGFTRLRYGIVSPPLALGVWGVSRSGPFGSASFRPTQDLGAAVLRLSVAVHRMDNRMPLPEARQRAQRWRQIRAPQSKRVNARVISGHRNLVARQLNLPEKGRAFCTVLQCCRNKRKDMLWLWLWLYISDSTGPHLATSSVAPAPCDSRRRASTVGVEEPSLARPAPLAGFTHAITVW